MLLGNSLKLKDVHVGKWIFLKKDAAENINVILEHFEPEREIKAEEGCYYVTSVDTSYINPPLLNKDGEVKMQIYLMHEKWDVKEAKPIHIALNGNADIILANAILLSDSLFNIIYDLEDLIEINKNRTTCISCKKPLNIISVNLKICKDCEENFLNISAKKKEENQELDNLWLSNKIY